MRVVVIHAYPNPNPTTYSCLDYSNDSSAMMLLVDIPLARHVQVADDRHFTHKHTTGRMTTIELESTFLGIQDVDTCQALQGCVRDRQLESGQKGSMLGREDKVMRGEICDRQTAFFGRE
jgi:hypothetical protein